MGKVLIIVLFFVSACFSEIRISFWNIFNILTIPTIDLELEKDLDFNRTFLVSPNIVLWHTIDGNNVQPSLAVGIGMRKYITFNSPDNSNFSTYNRNGHFSIFADAQAYPSIVYIAESSKYILGIAPELDAGFLITASLQWQFKLGLGYNFSNTDLNRRALQLEYLSPAYTKNWYCKIDASIGF